MTRDELEPIANLLWKADMTNYNDAMLKAEEILALFVEEGYLPPEYNIVVLNGVEGAIEVLKKKGWKSPEGIRELNDFWFNRGKEGRELWYRIR